MPPADRLACFIVGGSGFWSAVLPRIHPLAPQCTVKFRCAGHAQPVGEVFRIVRHWKAETMLEEPHSKPHRVRPEYEWDVGIVGPQMAKSVGLVSRSIGEAFICT